jgi:hypothetical protein
MNHFSQECEIEYKLKCNNTTDIIVRAGLCPWDNLGKANNWRPPPPFQYIKFAKNKKSEALQYCDSNEFIELTVGTSRVLMSKAATKNICSNKHKA